MTCANCSVTFGDGVLSTGTILSNWGINKPAGKKLCKTETVELSTGDEDQGLSTSSKEEVPPKSDDHVDVDDNDDKSPGTVPHDEESPPNQISIISALSMIFEISPIRLKSEMELGVKKKELQDLAQVFKHSSEVTDSTFVFCSDCGEYLTLLYNSFRDFIQILRVEGELGMKLKELEARRTNLTSPTTSTGAATGGGGSSTQRKRGRPKKNAIKMKEECVEVEVDLIKEAEDLVKKRGRRSKKVNPGQRKGSASNSDDSDVEGGEKEQFHIVKQEGRDMTLSDLDSEDEQEEESSKYKRFRRNDDDYEDSTPPDSPINLDPEPRPRSPRPVRQSSARNKDWASYYKDDDDDDEEEEYEAKPPAEQDNSDVNQDFIEAGNETEVTATEAEGDDDDAEEEEVPDPEAESILGIVEVAWKEGGEGDNDDSDEDYAPDSDLENLMAQGSKPSRGGRRKKLTKRAHPSTKCRTYECDTCGKLYAHLQSLQIHHRAHLLDSEVLYPCELCYKDFPSDDLLKRHRRQFHGEYIPYRMKSGNVDFEALLEQAKTQECPVCHELLQKSELQTHVNEHKVEYPWQCPLCPRAMSTLTEFTRHKILFHHQRPKFACEICHKEFRSLYHVKNHQEAVHNARSDKQPGDDSSSSEADQKQDLEEDSKNVDKKVIIKRRKHKCSECGKKYFRQDQLTEHLIIHGIGDKFKCQICGREFTHDSSKKRHMLLHADVNQYKCMKDDCDKSFTRKDHLTRHMDCIHGIQVAHQDIVAFYDADLPKKVPKAKEIPCPFCQKMVKRERMRLHLVSHTGEKKHACKQCGQKFGLRTTLRTHIQCVHQDLRRYACNFCDRAFKRSNHLKDHLKLHTEADNKPFQCDQCSKSFRREKNLKSHMVTHYSGKDFMCELCGKAFNRMDNMKAHVRAVHEGIQIRKKKTPTTAKPGSSRGKKTPQVLSTSFEIQPEEPGKIEDVSAEVDISEITDSTLANQNLAASSSSNIEEQSTAETSVIMRTSSRKPYQRKRKNPRSNVQPEEEIETETLPTMEVQIPPPGTIVTLAVDPTMGNVISADALANLGAVQIEEIHQGEGESFEHDGQRTTILQLAPGQVFPASSGQYETTYYQYTYYQQE